MGDGKKKTGLIIGLIVFGILALGSIGISTIGSVMDEKPPLEADTEEEETELLKQVEASKEEEREPENIERINPDEIKAELKKYIADKEQEIEKFYAIERTPERIAKFNVKLISDNDEINSKFEKLHGVDEENKVNLIKELPAVGYLYALSLEYMNKNRGNGYDPEMIKHYKDGIKEALED